MSSKYGTTSRHSGPLCNLFELAFALVSFTFARYTVLTSPTKDETAVHGHGLTFIGSVVVLVSRKAIFFYVVSPLQLCCMSVHLDLFSRSYVIQQHLC